jgi:integrase
MPKKAKARRDGILTRPGRDGFYAAWRDGTGRRVQRKLEGANTMEQARKALAAEKQKAAAIRNGEALPITEDTFAAFVEKFLKYQRKRISVTVVPGKLSAAEYTRQEGITRSHLIPHFGQMKLGLIRKVHVTEYIHKRTGAISDGTLIKEVNTLKRIFNVAVDLEKIAANPASRAKLPKAPEGRVRWLTLEKWQKLIVACTLYDQDWSEASRIGKLNKRRRTEGLAAIVPIKSRPLQFKAQWLQHATALATFLGTRRGELLHVQLSDIDLDRGTILLRITKTGKPRLAYLNEQAAQTLDTMDVRGRKLRGDLGPLFTGITPQQLTVAFRRTCQRAGIEDFSLHDCRHTFASWQRQNGADLHDIQILLGHSDPRMTARYAHLSHKHLATAAARLDGLVSLPGANAAETLPKSKAVKDSRPN